MIICDICLQTWSELLSGCTTPDIDKIPCVSCGPWRFTYGPGHRGTAMSKCFGSLHLLGLTSFISPKVMLFYSPLTSVPASVSSVMPKMPDIEKTILFWEFRGGGSRYSLASVRLILPELSDHSGSPDEQEIRMPYGYRSLHSDCLPLIKFISLMGFFFTEKPNTILEWFVSFHLWN